MRHVCDCGLQFREEEMFDQHKNLGCKPAASSGPTWSDQEPNEETNSEAPQE